MDGRRNGEHQPTRWPPGAGVEERDSASSSPASILLFALIGATATTAAFGQLRRTMSWFYTQLSRSEPYVYWEDIPRRPNRRGEAWGQYYQRMREKSEDQRERVERIRHMQDMFKKERSKCRDYRTRDGHNPSYYQNSRREEWYWYAESFYANQRTNFRSMPREAMGYTMSQHYSVLGLDRSRLEPFSDAEIKNAFRRKAMEYHPDQNQHNKEFAEAKFKEVMDSYEAIKLERQNGSL
uniref:J domain-containing protein n=1 Tax=Oryza glumipatula TaxID=40148 RepID=A0A0E0AFF6_9ORYZ